MFRFPWGDMHSLNLGWFLQKFNELRENWATAEAGIDGALDAEIQKAEDALSDVFDARDAAAASATAAASSASAANTSKTAAQNSATAAASSATLANQKASAAGLSEAAAAQSATAASNSATAAATSATQAGNSASAAQSSAAAAAASDAHVEEIIEDATTEAIASATQTATTAATNAANSATAAAGSESNAAGSATTAAGSAAAAASSATAAADSASDAETAAQSVETSAAQIQQNATDIAALQTTVAEGLVSGMPVQGALFDYAKVIDTTAYKITRYGSLVHIFGQRPNNNRYYEPFSGLTNNNGTITLTVDFKKNGYLVVYAKNTNANHNILANVKDADGTSVVPLESSGSYVDPVTHGGTARFRLENGKTYGLTLYMNTPNGNEDCWVSWQFIPDLPNTQALGLALSN